MATPTIVAVNPASGAEGVPYNVTLSVTFGQEVDTYRIQKGSIFLEGPDESKLIGAGVSALNPPPTDAAEFLASPGLKGIEKVDFTFTRVNESGEEVSTVDYGDGADRGELYRTKVTITPRDPLEALTSYTLYFVGDQDSTDDYGSGLSGRTVYDTLIGVHTGDGQCLFDGGYTGSTRKQFFLEITEAGVAGAAKFEWWTSADATHRSGSTSLGPRVLEDGVRVRFYEGGTYALGDTYSVWCDPADFFSGITSSTFITSSHSVETVPSTSVLVDGAASGVLPDTALALEILETNPADRASLVSLDLDTITITFSEAIDDSTVSTSTITVTGEAIDGSLDVSYTETFTTSFSVSGSVVTITLDPDEVLANNLVVVKISTDVTAVSGVTLSDDYEFFFGTSLTPYYAGVRAVRLRLGAYGSSFPTETIAFAIWMASMEAAAIAPALSVITEASTYSWARKQFTVCYAAMLGLGNLSGRDSEISTFLGLP